MIPRASQVDCFAMLAWSKIHRSRFSTCSCDAHCSWDLCRSADPPTECLFATESMWKLDNVKNAWVAQHLEGNIVHLSYVTLEILYFTVFSLILIHIIKYSL